MKDVEIFKKLALIGLIPFFNGLPWFYMGRITRGLMYTFTCGYAYLGSVKTIAKAGEIVDTYNAKRGYINTSRRDG